MTTKDIGQEAEIDQIMDALGDKMRRNILSLLKDKAMAVGDIAEQLSISRPPSPRLYPPSKIPAL